MFFWGEFQCINVVLFFGVRIFVKYYYSDIGFCYIFVLCGISDIVISGRYGLFKFLQNIGCVYVVSLLCVGILLGNCLIVVLFG